ncbi:PTS system mannitol-specific EIICBA component [Candidatus Hepatincola sp. Av]
MANIQVKIQLFGRFLSSMIMPNIGAFIAWGIITALFIPAGWFPNQHLAILVAPMMKYLLPLLIGYTGGKVVYEMRGGVVGAIATLGIIVGADIPMLMGAMIAGPLGGYLIKKFDAFTAHKVKSGFEMLVNNFSAGIIGMLLCLLGLTLVSPAIEYINYCLSLAVEFLVAHNLLALTSVIVEPSKVLFLNNAINHGIFTPLGLAQAAKQGSSIFFLIESNPGAGLGVLLAYILFEKEETIRQSAIGASIIHFFGGIHEVYFPYILMRPILVIALIAGGMSGVFTNSLLHSALVAPPSPGSILALLAMTPKGGFFSVIMGVVVASAVSFLVASFIIKYKSYSVSQQDATKKSKNLKKNFIAEPVLANVTTSMLVNKPSNESHIAKPLQEDILNAKVTLPASIKTIVFACDAGMGSSAMGASLLRTKMQKASLPIAVINKAIADLTLDNSFIITQKTLTHVAKRKNPHATHVSVDNFMDSSFYDNLVQNIKVATLAVGSTNHSNENLSVESNNKIVSSNSKLTGAITNNSKEINPIFNLSNIKLNLPSTSKEKAILLAGSLLHAKGYVDSTYGQSMLQREKETTTYIGNSVAIPHGTNAAKTSVLSSGIVFLQFKQGIDFGDGNIAKLVIGIAGKDGEHLELLGKIANILIDEKIVEQLNIATTGTEVLKLLDLS